jgi:hypothetical protein
MMVDVHLQVHGLLGDLQRAPQPGQERAEEQHAREQPSLVDTQCTGHLAVLGRSPYQHTPARAVEQ